MAEIDRFQHYQVLKHPDGTLWELGRGAMGITYKAFDTSLRTAVALKVISAQYLNSETARQRFLREARAAAQLRHPNVATVFHLGDANGTFFYAMEFVDGETVERRVQREGTLRLDVALRITRQVARALIAADRQHLVHRDVKPANIMLVRDDDEEHLLVKVIDFGLAKSVVSAADQSVTVTLGGFVGTPHFASPEQLEEREIDIRSDIYSLGASLWYMLSGRPPFQGSLASVIHQHLGQPLPAEVLASVPPRVAELLQAMLAKSPEQRIQSPADLKQRLDDLITELRGMSPTLVVTPQPGTAGGNGSSAAFATGQVIRGRFQVLGHAPHDRTVFKAKDVQTNRMVALRPLSPGIHHDLGHFEAVQQEVQRVKGVHHPNVLSVYGLETYEGGAMLVSDWITGVTLQDLLRVRRELRWEETDQLLRPVANLLDFLADRQLSFHALQLRGIVVEPARPVENLDSLARIGVGEWPPFAVKVDPLSVGALDEIRAVEPTQTLVELSTADIAPRPVHQLARLVYELLGGVRTPSTTALGGLPRFTPLATLSEAGNSVLRQGLTEPEKFPSAVDFLSELSEAQRQAPPVPNAAGTRAASGTTAATGTGTGVVGQGARSGRASQPAPEESGFDARSGATGRLLQLVTALVALLLLGALGTLLVTNWAGRKPSPPAANVRQGSVTLNTEPQGVAVKCDGQDIGRTPLNAQPLPDGKHTLELEMAGYQKRSLDVIVKDGASNNLGLLPLAPEVGQVTLKSDPPGATIYLADRELGTTPTTVTLPASTVELVSKIGALASVSQIVKPNLNGATVVEFKHPYGVVLVTSDRLNAEVFVDGADMGKAPVQAILPPGRHQLTARVEGEPEQTRVAEVQNASRFTFAMDFKPAATVAETSSTPPEPSNPAVLSTNGPSPAVPLNNNNNTGNNTAVATASPKSTLTPAPTRAQTRTAAEPGEEQQRRSHRRVEPAVPVYRSKEDYEHARDQAYDRFDAEWNARKNSMKQEKEYYEYQIDHSSGAAKERWKAKKEDVNRRLDGLDDQKDAAKGALKRRWNDD